jgi:NADPH:quinone reductase-like Zn-dependent oxidoreductase
MKAIVLENFGGIENMKYVDVEVPSINSKQILIRVKTTSVNYADLGIISHDLGCGERKKRIATFKTFIGCEILVKRI